MRRETGAVITFLLFAPTASAQLYAVDLSSPYRLVTVDRQTVAIAPVGPTGVSNLNGLAYDPNHDVFFAVNPVTDSLYRITRSTASTTLVGALGAGFPNVNSLAFDPASNILYAADNFSNRLMSINTATGAATALATLSGVSEVEGLTFDFKTGTLYGISDVNDRIVRIDPASGIATLVMNIPGSIGWRGLEYVPDEGFYAINSNQLFRMNPANGGSTVLVGNGLLTTQSLAYVPAPAAGGVLLIACAAWCPPRRRKRMNLAGEGGRERGPHGPQTAHVPAARSPRKVH